MKTSFWYHTKDTQPDQSGYYLSYRGWGLGGKADGDSDFGYLYYDKKRNEWRDYESTSMGHSAIVYYWTDAQPDVWVEEDPPVVDRKTTKDNPALDIALERVKKAIKDYELIEALT